MKSDKITVIFFIIVLTGIIGGMFHIFRLYYVPTTKTGSLIIISNPTGAIVFLNGQEKGKTPLILNEIPRQKYNIKLIKKDFKIWEGTVKVKKRTKIERNLETLPPKVESSSQKSSTRVVKPVTTMIKPVKSVTTMIKSELVGFGQISVSSFPAGSAVYLDGILQPQRTPMNISKVKIGKHRIRVIKDNYQPFEATLNIKENLTSYITAKLELRYGTLLIHSNPTGAIVYLDGVEKGKTPLTIPKLTPWQPYQLRLKLFKHYDWTANVFVDPGVDEKIEVNLRPEIEGYVYVTSIPSGCAVYLDDELIGNTPLRKFAIKPGNYTLKIMSEGYPTQTKEIIVQSDKSIFVNFALKEMEEVDSGE